MAELLGIEPAAVEKLASPRASNDGGRPSPTAAREA